MNIHKFIRKYPTPPSRPPVAVVWYPAEDLKYPAERIDDFKWKIYAQQNLTITPHSTKTIELKFCVEISLGVIIVSLHHELKKVRCSIQNESVVESIPDIIISIQNNSDREITINEGDTLCYLMFLNYNLN